MDATDAVSVSSDDERAAVALRAFLVDVLGAVPIGDALGYRLKGPNGAEIEVVR